MTLNASAAHQMGGPTGVVAKIRASNRAIGHSFKQAAALVVGGISGVAAYIGCTLLLHRRLFDPRIRRSSSWGDIAVLVPAHARHPHDLVDDAAYGRKRDAALHELGARRADARPRGAPEHSGVAPVYKLHIVLVFLITPFTRLVHIWSAPVWYLPRPGFQIVRSRSSRGRGAHSPTRGPAGGAPSYGGTTVLRQMAESGQEGA